MKKRLLTLILVLSMLLLTACSKEVQEKRERVIEGTNGVTQKEPSALEKNYRPTSGLDYRQVLFGNTYEKIIEVNADEFFSQYLFDEKPSSARIFRQKVGNETFYRVLKRLKTQNDEEILYWKYIDFKQDLYVVENGDLRLLIENMGFYENTDEYRSRTYGGIEIIERNDTVIGIMQFYNGDHTNTHSTRYYRWEDILAGNGIAYTLYSVENYGEDGSREKKALVDDRRPLMYTIQNAFDGDPTTSFVNFGNAILIDKVKLDTDGSIDDYLTLSKLEGIMVVNGYASGKYYYENNQIAEMSIIYSYGDPLYETYEGEYLYLEDSLKPQFLYFEQFEKDFTDLSVVIENIDGGTKYTDTALGEIDFYLEGMGWLFGFADEENAVDLSTVNTIDGLRYEFNDNTATVITYNGNDTEITIPSEVVHNGKTYTVTAIGDKVFQNRDNLSTVVISNGITSIGKNTFEGCKSLKELQLPETVISIGTRAFMNSGLENVNIPKKMTIIDGGVFWGTNITSIDIPEGITHIYTAAFRNCKNLESIIIPKSVVTITNAIFGGCENLERVTILNPKVDIGLYIFGSYGDENIVDEVDDIVTMYVYEGSTAHEYALYNDIKFNFLDE